MRIPIKALCEQKRTRKDGKALICLQYFHDGEHRIFLNTELAIPRRPLTARNCQACIFLIYLDNGVSAFLSILTPA
jgi:hypothetical protein